MCQWIRSNLKTAICHVSCKYQVTKIWQTCSRLGQRPMFNVNINQLHRWDEINQSITQMSSSLNIVEWNSLCAWTADYLFDIGLINDLSKSNPLAKLTSIDYTSRYHKYYMIMVQDYLIQFYFIRTSSISGDKIVCLVVYYIIQSDYCVNQDIKKRNKDDSVMRTEDFIQTCIKYT